MKYSLCLIRKRFSNLFPRKLMKVLSLIFTSNREDMFDLDSSLTRIAIVLINLIERIVTLFVWFVRSMWFIYQRDCDGDLSESVCDDLVLCSPSSKIKAEQKRQFARSERVGFRRRQVIQDGLGFWISFQWNLNSWISDSTSKNFSHSGTRMTLHGASSGRWKQVVSIQTQAVKLDKIFVHFKCSLQMNKKNILGEYLRFLSQVGGTILHLD